MSEFLNYKIGTCGQSNMVGQDTQTITESSANLRDFLNGWRTYTEVTNSLLPVFGTGVINAYQGDINFGVVRTEVAAKGVVTTWSDDTSVEYIAAVNEINLVNGIDDMLYYGAETDILQGQTKSTFKAAFQLMMSNFRTDTNNSLMRFFVIKPYAGEATSEDNAAIREALDELHLSGEIIIVGDAYNYQDNLIDTIHLNKTAMDLLGNDILTVFLSNISISKVIPLSNLGLWGASENIIQLDPVLESCFRNENSNTGAANVFRGVQAANKISGTLTDFAEGGGFIAENGDVPAHYLFQTSANNIAYKGLDLYQKAKFSIEFAFTPVSTENVQMYVLRHSGVKNIDIAVYNQFVYCYFFYTGNTALLKVDISSQVVLGVKTVVAFTFDGSAVDQADKAKVYCNGVYTPGVITGTFTTLTPPTTGATHSKSECISGVCKLHRMGLYLGTLTQDDVSTLYTLDDDLGHLIASDNGDGTMNLSAPYYGGNNLKSRKFLNNIALGL